MMYGVGIDEVIPSLPCSWQHRQTEILVTLQAE